MTTKKFTLFGFGILFVLMAAFLSQISLLIPLDRKARYQEMRAPLYDPILDLMCASCPRPLILLKTPGKMYVCETEEVNLSFLFPLEALKQAEMHSPRVAPGEKDKKKRRENVRLGTSLDGPNFDVTPKGLDYKQPKGFSLNWTWIIKPKSAGKHLLLMDFEGFPTWLFSFYKWDRLKGNKRDEWKIVQSLGDPHPIEVSVVTEIGLSPTMHELVKYISVLLGFLLMYPILIELLRKVFKLPESRNAG